MGRTKQYQRADVLPNVKLGALHYVFVNAEADPVDEWLRLRGGLAAPEPPAPEPSPEGGLP